MNRSRGNGSVTRFTPNLATPVPVSERVSSTPRDKSSRSRRSLKGPAMPTATAATLEVLEQRRLLEVLNAVRNGDFSVRMPIDRTGLAGKIADAVNDIIELNDGLAKELERVAAAVGKEGRMGRRAMFRNGGGAWTGSIESVNSLISDLVQPTAEMARVIGAVAKGDLSQAVPLEIEGRALKGDFLRIARVVNTMV